MYSGAKMLRSFFMVFNPDFTVDIWVENILKVNKFGKEY